MAHFIDKVVDFEESARKNKFSVHAGIDKNLDASNPALLIIVLRRYPSC